MAVEGLQRREVAAAWLLRFDALAHLFAGLVVFLPSETISALHNQLGIGEFPNTPIAWYLARGLPAYYAMHGACVLFISLDVRRYLDLIRFAMRAFAAYGILILIVDVQAAMPKVWTAAEPAFVLAFSACVLRLLSRSDLKPEV